MITKFIHDMKKNIFILIAVLIFLSCSSQNPEDHYTDEDGQKIEIGNPYSPRTGHYAGYEWAEQTGGVCLGKSQSFNEGCEEYYRQVSLSRK